MTKKRRNLIVLMITTIFLLVASWLLQYRINYFLTTSQNIKNNIKNLDTEINILDTEVSYLTSVERIKDIAKKHLKNFKKIEENDFIKIIDLPINPKFE